jgi:hypothetical protein
MGAGRKKRRLSSHVYGKFGIYITHQSIPSFLLWPDFPQSFPHRAHLIRQHDIFADNYMYGLNGSPTILRVALIAKKVRRETEQLPINGIYNFS